MKLVEEIWRPIANVPRIYEVSNLANVRKEMYPGQYELIKQGISDGYRTVCFEGLQLTVHKLVAEAFLPNSDPKVNKLVRFKDGNRQNPVATNLEWVSHSQVNQSKYKLGTKQSPLIYCVETEQVFSTCVAAASYFGMPLNTVSAAVKNGHVCFGKHFRYIYSEELPNGCHIHYISGSQLIELSKTLLSPQDIANYIV